MLIRIIILVFCFLFLWQPLSFAATCHLNYGFEDWDTDIATTPNYIFTVSIAGGGGCNVSGYTEHEAMTEVVTSYDGASEANWTPHSGSYFFLRNDSQDYALDPACGGVTMGCVQDNGYVGADYAYGGANNLDIENDISSGEIFISFWARRNKGFRTVTNYCKWVVVFTDDDPIYFHTLHKAGTTDDAWMYFYYRDEGYYLGDMEACANADDGNWHKWTYYVDFNNGKIYAWYDVTTETFGNCTKIWDSGDGQIGSTTKAVSVKIQGNFSASDPSEITYHALDDIEIWDGMPTAITAALTGTYSDGATEAEVVAGTEGLIITLDNDTWHADMGTNVQVTKDLIAGIDSGSSEAAGWDAEVKGDGTNRLTYLNITRTSATAVTIDFDAEASYSITTNETITVTVPASALVTSDSPIVATSTFEITATSDPACTLAGSFADNATEAEVAAGGEICIITVVNDTSVAAGATFDGVRQAIIDGFDSAQSETHGWNNEVRDKEVVTAVVRTNDTTITVTFTSAGAAYDISANETITVTVPAAALVTSGSPVVATPTSDIIFFDVSTEKITGMTLQ